MLIVILVAVLFFGCLLVLIVIEAVRLSQEEEMNQLKKIQLEHDLRLDKRKY